VPLFKTFEQLHADECEIYQEHHDAWHAAFHRWDLVKAVIADDAAELTKLTTGDAEMALAKSDAARFKVGDCGDHVLAIARATTELSDTLRSLVEKRNERLYGLGTLAKRSMRFASAHVRTNYGAGAQHLPPSAS